MSEIYVQSSQALEAAIQGLTQLDQQFMDQVESLDRELSVLVQKWEGEASDAFQERYQRERDYYCAFASLITEYIEALGKILATYEQAEASNVQIAGDGWMTSHVQQLPGIIEHLNNFNMQMKYGVMMPNMGISPAASGAVASAIGSSGAGHSGGGFSGGGSGGGGGGAF